MTNHKSISGRRNIHGAKSKCIRGDCINLGSFKPTGFSRWWFSSVCRRQIMMKELPAWLWGTIIGLIVFVLGLIDWLTGFELNFFVFYFLPVSLAAWFLDLYASMIVAILCAMVWIGADFLSGHFPRSRFSRLLSPFAPNARRFATRMVTGNSWSSTLGSIRTLNSRMVTAQNALRRPWRRQA